MENSSNSKTFRSPAFILIILFALLLVFYLYRWSQGTGTLSDFGTPLTFIFLISAMLVGKSNAVLYYILFGAAVLSLLGTLISLFI